MHNDSLNTLLTGQLPFILIVSAALALPLSAVLLWRYRKAVSRIMSERASQLVKPFGEHPEPVLQAHVNSQAGESQLCLQFVDAEHCPDTGKRLWREFSIMFRRAAGIHLFAGFIFALIMALAYVISGVHDIVMMQIVVMGYIFFWPAVIVFNLLTTTAITRVTFNIILYFIIFLIMNGIVLIRNPHMGFIDLFIVWSTYNLPPTLLLAAFLNHRIRAVGPMVWVFMFAAITGSLFAMGVTGASETLLNYFIQLGQAISLHASGIFVGILLAGFVVFSGLGWVLLRFLRQAYESRMISDQSLTVDSVMLIFAIYYAINLVFEDVLWFLSGITAFVVFSLTVRIGMKFADSNALRVRPLLVLRVFSLGKKSEALFQAIAQRWRYLGHVQLIAGPDLATATIEPHEFLTFLSGRLRQEFINGNETLRQRLATLETQKDFDRRFRINELFCFADTWKQALAALVDKQNTVLMDLRSFTARKPGCIHELNTLVRVVPLNRVLLVVDHTTDLEFLSQVLQQALRQSGKDVAANGPGNVMINVCRLSASTDPAKSLMPWLCAASE